MSIIIALSKNSRYKLAVIAYTKEENRNACLFVHMQL